jgi:hypothetical protein
MGRYNNFKNSDRRAKLMGEILARKYRKDSKDECVVDVVPDGTDRNHNSASSNVRFSNILLENGYVGGYLKDRTPKPPALVPLGASNHKDRPPDFDVSVLSDMPDLDLVLLQEASWDMEYAKTLLGEMHSTYPYIIYDIGVHSLKGNLWVGNSGLMLASKYDILDIRFGLFEKALPPCWYASKGLLQLKVIRFEEMIYPMTTVILLQQK